MTMQKLFLTFFGAGLSPKYPHIVGMFAALVIGALILQMMGPETLFMLVLATTLVGIFEINKYLKNSSVEDTKEILTPEVVIDKVAGVWLALLIAYSAAASLSYPYVQELILFFSFASFVLFDSWKPSTVGWLRKNVYGGLGIFGSAILSGFAAGFLTIVILLGIGRIL